MSAFSPHNKPLVSIYPIISQRSQQGFSPAPTTSPVTHISIFPVASNLHIQYCQHFPCCIQVTHTILPAFSLLCANYTYNTASIFPVASRLHMPYCQHFPCCIQITHTSICPYCIQVTHTSIFPVASILHIPAFSLLHPSYTCQHFPCCIQATHANISPVASKLHMPALSLLCPKATHTISVSSITSIATPNRKLLNNNQIKLVELVNSKSVNIHDTGDMIHQIQHKAHNLSLKKKHGTHQDCSAVLLQRI